jgi:hypothetical protein
MKILLDECLPKRLASHLAGHDVKTVTQMNLNGLSNGRLLVAADGLVDVFTTVDKNLVQQQKIDKLRLAIITLRAPSNKLEDLKPLVPALIAVLSSAKPGHVYTI